jgi:adenosine deaminase CECR1
MRAKMPKGALLHAHLDATVDKGYLLKLALQEPFMHVRTSCVVTTANSTTAVPEFRAFQEAQPSQNASVTDPDYQAGDWIPLHQARELFSPVGPDGFDKWVLGAMSINSAEAYGTHNTVTKVGESSPDFLSSSELEDAPDMAEVSKYLQSYKCDFGRISCTLFCCLTVCV